MIIALLLLLILASWIFWITAAWLVWQFFHRPVHWEDQSLPPVSVLKPVKGLDSGAYENFASFCHQDYPQYELLFGVADPQDPVVPLLNRLRDDFPHIPIQILIANPDTPNRKVGLLEHLSRRARYPVLVASDSDMRVQPDYLRRVVLPLNDPSVGLVTCPYHGSCMDTLTARLEALYMGVTFLPMMMVARKMLHMRFAMGATIAMRAADLARIGGYASIGDTLADDHEIGRAIYDSGLKVVLSDYIVCSILGATTFPEQWEREVRWAHCNRASRPAEYPGLVISFSTPLSVLLVLLSGFQPWAWGILAGSMGLRWLVGWLVTLWTHDAETRRWLFWLPMRDFLTALVWCAGFVGRVVIWRGEAFHLRNGGRLVPLSQVEKDENPLPVRFGRAFVVWLDALLRRFYRIYEFSPSPDCLFRLSVVTSQKERNLPGGAVIHEGDCVAIIHFSNERFPALPEKGMDLAWAQLFHRQMLFSLKELAAYVTRDPKMRPVKAFWGVAPFKTDGSAARLLNRMGFEIFPLEERTSAWGRFAGFWENVHTVALIWAFNPNSLKDKQSLQVRHNELWIMQDVLLEKYLEKPSRPAALAPYRKDGNKGKKEEIPEPVRKHPVSLDSRND